LTLPADPAAPAATFVLLCDGSFAIESPPTATHLLRRWLPLLPYADRRPAPGARLRLRLGDARGPVPSGAAALRLGGVSAWIHGDRARLRGDAGGVGRIHLGRRAGGVLTAPESGDQEAAAWDVYSMATLALALLLGRAGRALVHAAAPVAPDGRAWLLVGDTHAGKTTTSANLIEAGWRFTSDDHVVLSREAGAIWVEGLPRPFHLDRGWASGSPSGIRGEADPGATWPGRWLERAPLGGVILPRVLPERATALAPVPAAEVLTALVRQSPWLMADRAAASGLLALLAEAASAPARRLSLGLDTFASPSALQSVLAALTDAPLAGARDAGAA
jgi:hypothetical protein